MTAVELFGLPGAGKSTLWEQVSPYLSDVDDGLAAFGRRLLVAPALHPALVAQATMADPRWVTHRRLRTVVQWRARQESVQRHATRTVLQEGTAQEVFRSLRFGPMERARRLGAALLPAADLTIVVDVAPELAKVRMQGKARPNVALPWAPLDGEDWRRALDAYEHVTGVLGRGRVVRIGNDDSLDDGAEALMGVLDDEGFVGR